MGLKLTEAEDDFVLLFLPPLPPQCWDYRVRHPAQFYVELEMEPWAFCMLGKHPTELHSQTHRLP